MSFSPSHLWHVDGKAIPVALGPPGEWYVGTDVFPRAGDIYRAEDWWAYEEMAEGLMPNSYALTDDGTPIVIRTIGHDELGTLEAIKAEDRP